MEKASEVLLAARQLIERPGDWIRGPGMHAPPFCLLGALENGASERFGDAHLAANAAVRRAIGGGYMELDGIPRFNDSHTHAEVLGALNNAIGLALQAEGPTAEVMPARLDRLVVERANKTGPADGRVRSRGES